MSKRVAAESAYADFRREFLKTGCRLCALCEGRTQLVLDRGNPSARIMVVGEAPGAAEDKAGLSFVGRSGKLLDKIFASIGLGELVTAASAAGLVIRGLEEWPGKDARIPGHVVLAAEKPGA